MRHKKAGKKLGRTWEHRKAMYRNMSRSLIEHEQIRTTEAKAKEVRKVAEKLIGFGLDNSVHSRRMAFKILENRTLVKKLFDDLAPRFAQVSGGYTRVVKLGEPRRGDNAPLAVVEFTVAQTGAETKEVGA
ncbi:MAG: 50S ribosomal protein L17 [Desulfohalobiaceae bacterium]|nr:50S ribosomal protein L17 [Desulfohalobiaceae bacterium]